MAILFLIFTQAKTRMTLEEKKYLGVCLLFVVALILLCALSGCTNKDSKVLRYKKGQEIYLKPDSTKAVIVSVKEGNSDYKVDIGEKGVGFFDEHIFYVDDELIY